MEGDTEPWEPLSAGGARAGFGEAGPSARPYSVRRDELGGEGEKTRAASVSGAQAHGDGWELRTGGQHGASCSIACGARSTSCDVILKAAKTHRRFQTEEWG